MNEHEPQQHGEPELPENHERHHDVRPMVWIGSLADYNAGLLTGDWIDAAVEDDELLDAARSVVANSHTPGAEEWAIFDFEGFGSWRPGEHEDLATVATIARGIRDHGPAVAAWADLHDADPDMLVGFEDAYLGHYDSPAAWAEHVMEDMGLTGERGELTKAIPESLQPYIRIDYAMWARDCFLEGSIYFEEDPAGGVWVFDPRR